ncbi:MAG: 30S ribosomal protein S21 [Candidatus Pacebacteria bacterium]|jgi:hypothetical protein|nr:30S ribosomal protein S21 [Candidatus Paceibacterota bacterium]|tara:strand:- start:15436 stop:15690 length:255 start_codon:yes stop_codon:yes gene_type:complete
MNVNVQVDKSGNENTMGLLRRFTKRVRGSGVLSRVRGIRYYQRQPSSFIKKKKALKGIAKREKFNELLKLGKVTEQSGRFRKRR